MTEMKNTAF